jgi:hypothetical protein
MLWKDELALSNDAAVAGKADFSAVKLIAMNRKD